MSAAAAARKFPMQAFKKTWDRGIASWFVPSVYRKPGVEKNIPGKLTEEYTFDPELRDILMGHHAAQIPLAVGAEKNLQEKYFTLMVNHPIVAASPKTGESATEEATFTVKEQHFVLNGRDIPYHNAEVASMFIIHAKNEDNTGSFFVLDKHVLGIEVKTWHKGEKLRMPLVSFHDVIVPKENMIGQLGDGVKLAEMTSQKMLNHW